MYTERTRIQDSTSLLRPLHQWCGEAAHQGHTVKAADTNITKSYNILKKSYSLMWKIISWTATSALLHQPAPTYSLIHHVTFFPSRQIETSTSVTANHISSFHPLIKAKTCSLWHVISLVTIQTRFQRSETWKRKMFWWSTAIKWIL